jgi:hypothetical protein
MKTWEKLAAHKDTTLRTWERKAAEVRGAEVLIVLGWTSIVMRMASVPEDGMENWEEMAARAKCNVRRDRAEVSTR